MSPQYPAVDFFSVRIYWGTSPIVSDEGDEYYCLEPGIDGNQAVYAWDPFGSEFIRKQSDSLFELIWQDIVEHAIPNAKENGDVVNL